MSTMLFCLRSPLSHQVVGGAISCRVNSASVPVQLVQLARLAACHASVAVFIEDRDRSTLIRGS